MSEQIAIWNRSLSAREHVFLFRRSPLIVVVRMLKFYGFDKTTRRDAIEKSWKGAA